VCGVEVGLIVLVVQVRQVVIGDNSFNYLVDDDTGSIEAVHYKEESTMPAVRNTFVKIIGAMKPGREQNMVTVYRMFTIRDMDEVAAHRLALVATPLRIMRQQAIAANMAQASLAGIGFTQPNVHIAKGGDGAGMGLTKMMSSKLQQPKSWVNQAFSQPSKPAAIKVLGSIKVCVRDVGISRRELHSVHKEDLDSGMVDEMLEYLAMEGHIYTTMDEHHFKSTDA